MKNAAGMLELLIVIIIITVLYFSFFAGLKTGRKDPFNDNVNIQNQEEIIDSKIQEIEDSKLLKQKIESNLKENY